MKENELRVGNLAQTAFGIVEYRGVSPDKPNLLFVKYSNEIDVREHIDDIKPIPLTEEWLIKFGFKQWKDCKKWSFNNVLIYTNRTSLFYYGKARTRIYVEYVHQLQNLYFALIGEELEIKDKHTLVSEETD